MAKAVAVDLGAGSGRIALGEIEDGRIEFKIVRQISHEASFKNGLLRWNFALLLDLCREGATLAVAERAESLGIDSWGVDHGFVDENGVLIDEPVCYRDLSHLAAFEKLAPHRKRLYELTGIQHQPFNTICQLIARSTEGGDLLKRAADWMILPDLLGYMLSGTRFSELTEASTTQLMGLDGNWSTEAFQMAGWPVPPRAPASPGQVVGRIENGVSLVSVGSHDTASAVAGFGALLPTDLFLNSGTWSLCGAVVPKPIATEQAEKFGFTNEWTVDGKIRLLKNIPGFYFINRLHQELKIETTVPEWLESSVPHEGTLDLFDPGFFNPGSMLEICGQSLKKPPASHGEWAAVALNGIADAVAKTVDQLTSLTSTVYDGLKIAGGGARSSVLCQKLADRLGIPVKAGPPEATVLGNLAAQFLSQGVLPDWDAAFQVVDRSIDRTHYDPT